MNKSPLIIVSAANERYSIGLGVMMCSALLCADGKNVRFYVVDDGLEEHTKSDLVDRVISIANSLKMKVEINFIDFSNLDLPDLPPLNGSLTSYARLFLCSLLIEDGAFYVDSDIICNRSFSLLEKVIDQHPDALLIGCEDGLIRHLKNDCPWLSQLNEQEKYLPYINAGFIYMNLKNLRTFQFEDKFYSLVKEGQKMRFADQTALNFLCRGRIGMIDPKFNVLWGKCDDLDSEAMCNIHFVGPIKPWHSKPSSENLQSIKLFYSTARFFGLNDTTLSGWDELRITISFYLTAIPKLIFYKLTLSKKISRWQLRIRRWRSMSAFNNAQEARLLVKTKAFRSA